MYRMNTKLGNTSHSTISGDVRNTASEVTCNHIHPQKASEKDQIQGSILSWIAEDDVQKYVLKEAQFRDEFFLLNTGERRVTMEIMWGNGTVDMLV